MFLTKWNPTNLGDPVPMFLLLSLIAGRPNRPGSPSSTEVDQDAPSLSHSPTTIEIQSPVLPQDVGNENMDIEVAHMGNDPLPCVPITEVDSGPSSSTASPQANVQPINPLTYPNSKWTKDHPLNHIIGPLSRPVSTRVFQVTADVPEIYMQEF
nr:hypothetical protein [Tanacetum cinerariifolium]